MLDRFEPLSACGVHYDDLCAAFIVAFASVCVWLLGVTSDSRTHVGRNFIRSCWDHSISAKVVAMSNHVFCSRLCWCEHPSALLHKFGARSCRFHNLPKIGDQVCCSALQRPTTVECSHHSVTHCLVHRVTSPVANGSPAFLTRDRPGHACLDLIGTRLAAAFPHCLVRPAGAAVLAEACQVEAAEHPAAPAWHRRHG